MAVKKITFHFNLNQLAVGVLLAKLVAVKRSTFNQSALIKLEQLFMSAYMLWDSLMNKIDQIVMDL